MRLQFAEQVYADRSIDPFEVPVFEIFFDDDLKIEIPANLFDDLILCVDKVDGDGFDSFFAVFMFMFDGG